MQNVGNRQARRAIGVVCILSGLSGCLNLGVGVSPTVGNMLTSVVSEGSALPEFARAAGGPGSMRVSGQIVGRLRCDYLSPDLREVDGGLELVVTIVSGRQGCNSLTPSTLSYVANIYNVEPGSWSILVEHRYEGVDGTPGERLYDVVTVN
ncbi:hypothetical protein [Candidatus Palauibacter irciniicola]|uniref:hypothetical protein n=1 Tax=Candidatus Palauibacter irciniicola TaxID=3056733 RepID=UPI003B01D9B3